MAVTLSIAIPTFNGAATIGETLDSIVSQLVDGIEVVVSDNASTDQTPEIIGEYQAKYPVIHYFRNETNLGSDINTDLAVKRSKGDFVWIMSDDDAICDGALSKILAIISSNPEIVYIHLNYNAYDQTLTKLLTLRAFLLKHNVLFTSPDDLLMLEVLEVGLRLALISSNIVRRDKWLSIKTEKYYGTRWVHLAVILEYLPGHKFYLIASPCVKYRSYTREREDEKQALNILFSLVKILSNLPLCGYKKQTANFWLTRQAMTLPWHVLMAKSAGLAVSVKDFKEMVKEFHRYPIHLLFSLFIYVLPRPICRLLRHLYLYILPRPVCHLLRHLYRSLHFFIWNRFSQKD